MASVNEETDQLHSQLFTWAAVGDERFIEILALLGVGVNTRDEEGNTPLILASENGNTHYVSALLKAGADVDMVSNDRDTALISAGADVNMAGSFGTTALVWAAVNGYQETLDLLIQAGANVNLHNPNGWTALKSAIANRSITCVSGLIAAGADVKSTLMLASMQAGSPGLPLYPVSCRKVTLRH